jgi:hypothetical protein
MEYALVSMIDFYENTTFQLIYNLPGKAISCPPERKHKRPGG